MTDFGLVSIITPSYNCSQFIGETIESIQSQSYTNWELLVTDDCSSDNSREVIKSYAEKDPRIKLLILIRILVQEWHVIIQLKKPKEDISRSAIRMIDGILKN